MGSDALIQTLLLCRAEKQLTLDFVAREIGITQGALSRLEMGRSRPKRTTRLLIERFLDARGYSVTEQEVAG